MVKFLLFLIVFTLVSKNCLCYFKIFTHYLITWLFIPKILTSYLTALTFYLFILSLRHWHRSNRSDSLKISVVCRKSWRKTLVILRNFIKPPHDFTARKKDMFLSGEKGTFGPSDYTQEALTRPSHRSVYLLLFPFLLGPNIKSKESKRKEDLSIKPRSPVGANPVTSSRFTVSPANDPHLVWC